MAAVATLYRDPEASLSKRQRVEYARRGVMDAVNEYETMSAFGGYLALYGADAPPPTAAYVARTRLVMAGIAKANREMSKADGDGGSSMGSGSGGERRRTISHVRSGSLD